MAGELNDIVGDTPLAKPAKPVKAPASLMATVAPDFVKPEITHREFGDADAMRTAIFDNVNKAISSRYPLENTRYRLAVENVHMPDPKPYTLEDQKKAIIQGHSLEKQLHGEWVLYDKATNKEVDRKKSVIAHVPYATHRGTFIYNGSEYSVSNQMRLKPGVYTRVKDNGILEAHINTKPGTGPSYRIYMEPDTGIFRLGVGQSTLKMYPILRSMGVPDREIEKHWGKELLQKNIEAEDPRAVSRAFAKLVATRADLGTSEANVPKDQVADPGEQLWKEAEAVSEYAPDFTWEANS